MDGRDVHCIPAKILYNWDFSRYPVSKWASKFLFDTEFVRFYDLEVRWHIPFTRPKKFKLQKKNNNSTFSCSTQTHTVPSKNSNWCDRFVYNWNTKESTCCNVASNHFSNPKISNFLISISIESTGIRWTIFWPLVTCWRNYNRSLKMVEVTLLIANGVVCWVAYVNCVPMMKWFFRSMLTWCIG